MNEITMLYIATGALSIAVVSLGIRQVVHEKRIMFLRKYVELVKTSLEMTDIAIKTIIDKDDDLKREVSDASMRHMANALFTTPEAK